MCRAQFPRGFAPTVDLAMQQAIKDEMPKAYEKRMVELIHQKEWVGQKKLMRFTYGNTCKKVTPSDSSQSKMYSYAAFFILNEDRTKTDGYIKKVTY